MPASTRRATVTTTITQFAPAARRLRDAARTRVPCNPVRDLIGRTDAAAAYAVQQQLTQDRLAHGARIVGRKVGLTSTSVQEQLGVDQPDFGVLFDDMEVTDGVAPTDRLMQPKVEAEIAFILSADLDGPVDPHRVRAAVASAHVALEIVDSRVRDWDISFADTVADNASSGLFALGTKLPAGVEPRLLTMTMARNGTVVSTGRGTDCLGDPLNALLWLATTARDLGDPLRAGQVVLSGALGPMAAVGAGDRVEAEVALDGNAVGNIDLQFTKEGE